jgi:signal transduction histidine kinase
VADDSQAATNEFLIATIPPSPRQERLALLVIAILVLSFAASVPFASDRLTRIDSFVPTVEAIDFVADLATAILLFGQFEIIRSRALLVLASAYLYAALILAAHALSYPGAFTPNGVFQIGIQATPWLYNLWRFGFSASVAAYAWMINWTGERAKIPTSSVRAVWLSITAVMILVGILTWGITVQEPILLPLLSDVLNFTSAANKVPLASLLISFIALVLLALRRTSVLDLWLVVALCGMVVEQTLVSFFVHTRFSFGHYSSRVLAVAVSTIVLIALLSETVTLYNRLVQANRGLQRERASKLLNAQAAIAATIHQLRQPLAAIGIGSATATRFLAQTPPDAAHVQRIHDDIIGATSHANEVLESIRALFEDTDQSSTLVNVNELVAESLQVVQNELEDHGIAASTQLAPDLPLIGGHKGQLEEVILNLVHNSIDAMRASTSKLRAVSVQTKQQGREQVVISVQDTGPGIAPERIMSVFDAFVTTKPKGKGLGLAIAKMIIERHGGQISVRSDPGSGARFDIRLPIKMTAEHNGG